MRHRLAAICGFAALFCGAWIATAAAGELTFRYNDSDERDIRAALDVFEKQNPGTTVTLERGNWADALPQFLREAAVGSGPDVIQSAFVWVKDLATAGSALPLDPFVVPQKATDAFADYIALDLEIGKDGKVYGLPWTVDTWSMVYNTDLLKKAGVAAIPTTWDAFRAAAEKVHQATGKSGFLFPYGSAASNSMWFVANFWWWSHGQSLVVDKPGAGYTMGVDAAGIAAAMQYFDSLLKDGSTPKSMIAVSNWGDPAIIEPMVAGDAMAVLVPPANFKQIVAEWQAHNPGGTAPFSSALVPADKAGSITMIGGRSLVVNANTQDPKGAWKLVQFLASRETFDTFYKAQLPARKSLLQSMKFDPGMEGFVEQLQRARTWGPYADGPVKIPMMWNEVGRDFGSVFIGEATPEQSAQRLVAAIGKDMK